MLVALAHGLRVEQPITSDSATLLAAVRRMEKDAARWNSDYAHLTERPLFRELDDLYVGLANEPGAKAMILFSDAGWPGTANDDDLRHAAELASNARTAVYPVLPRGLASHLAPQA